MNYLIHYDRLILRARARVLHGYSERHHIVPRCIGGSNKQTNIVILTAREHYVAHQLLAKMYPNSMPLNSTVMLMAPRCGGNRAFEWIRARHSEFQRERMRGVQLRLNKRHSDATKAKISSSKRNKLIRMTPSAIEARRKLALSKIGVPRSATTRAKIAIALTGRTHSAETRAKLSALWKGRHHSARSILKMSRAKIGTKASEDTKAKLRAAWVNRKIRIAAGIEAHPRARTRKLTAEMAFP